MIPLSLAKAAPAGTPAAGRGGFVSAPPGREDPRDSTDAARARGDGAGGEQHPRGSFLEEGFVSRYCTWKEAHAEAQKRADSSGLDVAIRRQKEFGKDGHNIKYASWNDNDYAVAEIVTPKGKQPTDRNTGRRG